MDDIFGIGTYHMYVEQACLYVSTSVVCLCGLTNATLYGTDNTAQ